MPSSSHHISAVENSAFNPTDIIEKRVDIGKIELHDLIVWFRKMNQKITNFPVTHNPAVYGDNTPGGHTPVPAEQSVYYVARLKIAFEIANRVAGR